MENIESLQIVMARKPLTGTVADNVTAWGVGGINVDGCRIETTDNLNGGSYGNTSRDVDQYFAGKKPGGAGQFVQPSGRWPANVILDSIAGAALDAQSGDRTNHAGGKPVKSSTSLFGGGKANHFVPHTDSGGASRFFYNTDTAEPIIERTNMHYQLLHGDNREQLKHLADNSIDSIVCDPPYELGFMGKRWDSTGIAYDGTVWTECLRVLKPGGHLIAFGGTRTYHRMTVAIEDAGFEIRDCIMWLYGSGFPKSLDVSKALDKQAGAEREVVTEKRSDMFGEYQVDVSYQVPDASKVNPHFISADTKRNQTNDYNKSYSPTTPATDLAKQWHGWGTALKPAVEPAVLARKPLIGTVADNVTTWGVGGINVDGCRVETTDNLNGGTYSKNSEYIQNPNEIFGARRKIHDGFVQPSGRWPANVILDEDAGEALDEQSGELPYKGGIFRSRKFKGWQKVGELEPVNVLNHSDSGGASRFFYTAKASKAEREAGLDRTCTVKYNIDRSILGGLSWNDVSTVVAQLLQKVTSELAMLKWLIDESGASITALYPSDSSFITSMETSKTTALKICNSLMRSLTSESMADVNCEMESGSSHAKSVEQLKAWILTTTNGKTELALGAVNVALTTLQQISESEPSARNNSHSTVKPIALMRYLVRLVTPKDGTVLDPFMGSGSTGCAAMCEGMDFVGIELSEEYLEIARRRIEYWQSQNPMGL